MPHREARGARFAERTVRGRDDEGRDEIISLWIERKDGALWSVGRWVNVSEREGVEPRRPEVVFEGYEMDDALTAANEALEADLAASEDNDDHNDGVRPFGTQEVRSKLERWFFDHA
jgi:hypothetical protein